VYQVVREASSFSRLGVRAAMFAMSGSLSPSYTGCRDCYACDCWFTFEHFLNCPALGVPIQPSLVACVENKDWTGAAEVILSRFEVFLQIAEQTVVQTLFLYMFSSN
jgi:hypothetical protein